MPVRLERDVVRLPPVAALDVQHHDVRLPFAVALVIPVRTHGRELEPDDRPAGRVVHPDVLQRGLERALADAVLGRRGAVHQDALADIVEHVLLPGDAGPAVEAVEPRAVLGEVAGAELVVVHGEELRLEVALVRHAGPLHVAGAPAAVDQLPLAVVDAHRVPRVARGVGWDGRARPQRCVAVAFAVPADDDAFEACGRRERCEERGVAFADGEPAAQRAGGCRGLHVVGEEGFGVIVDVVVQPSEDGTRFVGEGGEGRCQLMTEPGWVGRGNGLPGESRGVVVGAREVAAF